MNVESRGTLRNFFFLLFLLHGNLARHKRVRNTNCMLAAIESISGRILQVNTI